MEKYQGDLADIIRASGGTISGTLGSIPTTSGGTMSDSCQFQLDPINFDNFGHPFSSLRDPLLPLDQIDMSGGSSSFFSNSNSLENDAAGFCRETGNSFIGNLDDHQHDQEIKKPNTYFSTMLQISQPNANLSCDDSQSFVASARLPKVPSSTLIPSNVRTNISAHSSKAANSYLIRSTGLQISSPLTTGIKRR